ncbi:hypothetical protein OCJ37_16785 [Xanthomonas sp. AM6]|nr:hypothetical protein [Xanthomonas sp. AM6]UYB51609.1 hypothetical protein OCJ37_16785 [Xanthomonas sp. AM6]
MSDASALRADARFAVAGAAFPLPGSRLCRARIAAVVRGSAAM